MSIPDALAIEYASPAVCYHGRSVYEPCVECDDIYADLLTDNAIPSE